MLDLPVRRVCPPPWLTPPCLAWFNAGDDGGKTAPVRCQEPSIGVRHVVLPPPVQQTHAEQQLPDADAAEQEMVASVISLSLADGTEVRGQ